MQVKPEARTVTQAEVAASPALQQRVVQKDTLQGIITQLKEGAAADTATTQESIALAQVTGDEQGAQVVAQILGSSLNENYDSAGHKISTRTQQDDVLRTTIKLYNGANALTLVEEKLEGDAKVILERQDGRDWLLSRLRAYEKDSGDTLLRAVGDDHELRDNDLIEAWSHLGQSYLLGRSTFGAPLQNGRMAEMLQSMASAGLSSAFNAESQFWNMVQARAQKLAELHAAGKLDATMAAELESQLGIGEGTDGNTHSGTHADEQDFVVRTDSGTFSMLSVPAQQLRDALQQREPPTPPLENPTPQSAFQWWEQNMVGNTIQTPIGLSFTPQPGHFFRFVAGKPPGQQKGFVPGFETAADAMQALREGRIDAAQVTGWQGMRASHLPMVEDMLSKPDYVLLERRDYKNAIKFIKRYKGAWATIGFGTTDGTFAPLSFSPRKLKVGELTGDRLMYVSPEMEGMQNTLPALPSNHSGIWQGQDPESWVNNYPIIEGVVNTEETLSLRSSETAPDELSKNGGPAPGGEQPPAAHLPTPQNKAARLDVEMPAIQAIDDQIYGTDTTARSDATPGNPRGDAAERLVRARTYIGGGPSSAPESPGGQAEATAGQSGESARPSLNHKEARARLIEWAGQNGLLIDKLPPQWKLKGPDDIGGMEHHVFLVSTPTGVRYVKITKGNGTHFGLWPEDHGRDWSLRPKASAQQYLDRLSTGNIELGDLTVLHAVLRDPTSGMIRLVTSQPEYIGDPVDESFIATGLHSAGFVPVGDSGATFYRASDNTAVLDAHIGNGIRQGQLLYLFDVTIMHPEGRLKERFIKESFKK
ncbi:MAG: hypothetical protein ACO1TE_13985 [Prosthecobacter sp.]